MANYARRRRGRWKRPPLWIAAAVATLVICALIDAREKADADFSLFYTAAVAATGWWLGRRHASVAAVLAAAAWTYADLARRPPEEARFAIWNGFTRLAIFLFAGLVTARVRADERRLRRSRRVLEEEILQARTDLVTDLPNTRGFLELLDRGLVDPQHRGLSFSIACIDIEGLDAYEDAHEPAAADDLARDIAAVVRRAIRASDIAARLEREEFAVAFWDVEKDVVVKTLCRIGAGVEALTADEPQTRVSARIGLALFADPPGDPRDALRYGERALHEAHAEQRTLLVREEDSDPPAAPAADSA